MDGDGAVSGIRQGSSLTEAAATLQLTPEHFTPDRPPEDPPPFFGCTGTPDPWLLRSGGLTLVFEGTSSETAAMTNWMYVGGPTLGFSKLVAPGGLEVGGTRAQVVGMFPDHQDFGNEIHLVTPLLRFYLDGDTITAFGIIDCVLEGFSGDPEPGGVTATCESTRENVRYPIRRCDSGVVVAIIKDELFTRGYFMSPDDDPEPAVFTDALVDAVTSFQRDNGLDPDGLVGPLTWQALRGHVYDAALDTDGNGRYDPYEIPLHAGECESAPDGCPAG